MSANSAFITTKSEIEKKVVNFKRIHNFQTFLTNQPKEFQHFYFDQCRNYMNNEKTLNDTLSKEDHDVLLSILNHWQWSLYGDSITQQKFWWRTLFLTPSWHSCKSLIEILDLILDTNNSPINETSSIIDTSSVIDTSSTASSWHIR